MFRIAKLLSLAALPIFSLSSFAQPGTAAGPSSIMVNVLDRNGSSVRGLAKDNFVVKVNGRSVAVLGAEYSLAPRRVVVLFDVSGSMEGPRDTVKWRIAREEIEDLLTQTPIEVPIAFLTFSERVRDVFDFREGREAMLHWFRAKPAQRNFPRGRTALLDAVIAGVKMLQPSRAGDSLYVITDGGDNSSHVSLDQTKEVLRDRGVRVFGFLLADPMGMFQYAGNNLLAEMAEDSGGFAFGVSGQGRVTGLSGWSSSDPQYVYNDSTQEKLKLSAQAFNVQLNGFYTVQTTALDPANKARRVSLTIVDGTGQPRKDVTLTYPRDLAKRK